MELITVMQMQHVKIMLVVSHAPAKQDSLDLESFVQVLINSNLFPLGLDRYELVNIS